MTDILAVIAPPSPETGTEDELRSLLRWLHADESVDVRGRIGTAAPPPAHHMGAGFDLLELAIGSGLSAASLVFSVLQWQSARRGSPSVTLRRGDVEIVLTREAAADEAALRGLIAWLDTAPAPASHPSDGEQRGDDGTA